VKAASYKFQDTFFNGDVTVDTKSFDGLKKRLTGAQVLDAGTNGIPIVGNGSTDPQAFFDQLDALIAAVPGITPENGALYANSSVRAKIISAGRRIGGVDIVREDITGKRVATWNGIPVLDPGANLAGHEHHHADGDAGHVEPRPRSTPCGSVRTRATRRSPV
jgi:hypothetical protein